MFKDAGKDVSIDVLRSTKKTVRREPPKAAACLNKGWMCGSASKCAAVLAILLPQFPARGHLAHIVALSQRRTLIHVFFGE